MLFYNCIFLYVGQLQQPNVVPSLEWWYSAQGLLWLIHLRAKNNSVQPYFVLIYVLRKTSVYICHAIINPLESPCRTCPEKCSSQTNGMVSPNVLGLPAYPAWLHFREVVFVQKRTSHDHKHSCAAVSTWWAKAGQMMAQNHPTMHDSWGKINHNGLISVFFASYHLLSKIIPLSNSWISMHQHATIHPSLGNRWK